MDKRGRIVIRQYQHNMNPQVFSTNLETAAHSNYLTEGSWNDAKYVTIGTSSIDSIYKYGRGQPSQGISNSIENQQSELPASLQPLRKAKVPAPLLDSKQLSNCSVAHNSDFESARRSELCELKSTQNDSILP